MTHSITPPAVKAVQRGAAVLDEHFPNWFQQVHLGNLEISSCTRCVLGQLGGGEEWSYAEMIDRLSGEDDPDDWSGYNGFDSDFCNYGTDDLTVAWKDLIEKRRAEVSA